MSITFAILALWAEIRSAAIVKVVEKTGDPKPLIGAVILSVVAFALAACALFLALKGN